MLLTKTLVTATALVANLILLPPWIIKYDWLVASFVLFLWLGFIGIIWEDELKRIRTRKQK